MAGLAHVGRAEPGPVQLSGRTFKHAGIAGVASNAVAGKCSVTDCDVGFEPAGCRRVARIARLRCWNMRRRIDTDRKRAVVTSRARGRRLNLCVVEGEFRCPCRRLGSMACLAHVAGVQSESVFAALAARARECAAVARDAVAGQRGVINCDVGFEPAGLRGVARIAGLGCRNMSDAFAGFGKLGRDIVASRACGGR